MTPEVNLSEKMGLVETVKLTQRRPPPELR